MGKQYVEGIRFTIPDKPPLEQAQMIEDLIKVIRTFEKLSGEHNDLSEMEERAVELRKRAAQKPIHEEGEKS